MCQCQFSSFPNHAQVPSLKDIQRAAIRLQPYIKRTEFTFSPRLAQPSGHNIFLKREDQQEIRSFKVRGALNKMLSLSNNQKQTGVVCASAGNHAQGFAFACHLLGIQGVVFLPQNTPEQKVRQVKYYGKNNVDVVIFGSNFDHACQRALKYTQETGKIFVHPFDDPDVIAGQATLALEMISDQKRALDVLLVPVGGGGLASGVSLVYKSLSPQTRVLGVEVEGAEAMHTSLAQQRRIRLNTLDLFADGTAVKQVGRLPFDICRQLLDGVIVVTKKQVCEWLFSLNNELAMIVEPAGALAVTAAMTMVQGANLNVGCIVSGGNNDAFRYSEYERLLRA